MGTPTDSSASPTAGTGIRWRLALLVTTLALGAALVTSGFDRRRAALENAEAVTEAEVHGMLIGARRELVRARGDHEEILAAMHDELGPRGLKHLALITPDGTRTLSLGQPTVPFSPPPHAHTARRGAPLIQPLGDDGLVHAYIAVGRNRRNARHERGQRSLLAVEIMPVGARAIVSAAERALAVEIGAAGLLLLAAAVFWRMSRRAERVASRARQERAAAARQLERDRQLKLLGQMSAVLGHELRNPITALKGNAQLLAEKLAGHAAEERARGVVEAAVQLEQLTGEVLEFARTGELHRSRVYVDDLLNSAAVFAEADPVTVAIGDDLPAWSLDRERMERVLANLLRNARQATEDGQPVEIAATVDGALVIEVRDRGPGIPAGDEQRIFEPFYTRRAQGTGLGLALARRVVEAHGGAITACSRDGGGAVFRVSLPRHAGEEAEQG